MKTTIAFLVVLSCLSACGGKTIDATNGDTLQASVTELSASMTEDERMEFGQDLYLIMLASSGNNTAITIGDMFVPSGGNFGAGRARPAFYVQLSKVASATVDDTTAKEIHSIANNFRQDGFGAIVESLNGHKVNIQESIERMKGQLSSLEKELVELREVDKKTKDKANRTVRDLSYDSLSFQGGRLFTQGTITVENTFDNKLISVAYNINAILNDSPNLSSGGAGTLEVRLSPPLEPGKVRKNLKFKTVFSDIGFKDEQGAEQRVSLSSSTSFKQTDVEFFSAKALSNDSTANRPRYIRLQYSYEAPAKEHAVGACSKKLTLLQDQLVNIDASLSQLLVLQENPAFTDMRIAQAPTKDSMTCS